MSDFDQDMDESDQEEPAIYPTDERRLVTQSYDLSVSTLIEQWKDGTLKLPEIQREYVWNNTKASRLIESLLLNVPIPVLYLAESGDKYDIIDGHQRVASVVRFVENEFRLIGLKVLGDADRRGKRFHQLPPADQRRIRTRVMRAIIITEESHPSMKFEVFERLNSGSIQLNAQEIRHSTHRGPFISMIKRLVKVAAFRTCIGTKLPRRREVDTELVLRYFAFSDDLENYRPPLQRFLNNYCAIKNKQSESVLQSDETRFLRAAENVQSLYGGSAFRLTDETGKVTDRNINRALAETQLVTLGLCDSKALAARKVEVMQRLAALHRDPAFLDDIQRATGDRARTLGRMRQYREAIEDVGLVTRG
jgi:hypothetical protein